MQRQVGSVACGPNKTMYISSCLLWLPNGITDGAPTEVAIENN